MRIGLIGGGFMGEALVSAVLKQGVAKPGDVVVSDVAQARRDHLSSTYSVAATTDNAAAARGADLVVLAVKPQEFSGVGAGLRGKLDAAQGGSNLVDPVVVAHLDHVVAVSMALMPVPGQAGHAV